jgi:phosphomevalonate kinase
MSQTTVISAPGKVLIAGGYLVLDQLYSGLVLATSSRFYTVIRDASASGSTPSSSSETETPIITVRAGQFPKDGSIWVFAVRMGASDAGGEGGRGGEVKLGAVGDAKNKFVQITLECGLRYVQARLRQDLGDQEGDKELLRRLRREEGGGLDVVVLADNDFYSQRETVSSSFS